MNYDVIVAGAGPAGFAAALGAVKAGKKVLLLDKNSMPGGVAVFCGCPVFSGITGFTPELIGGVAGEFAFAMREHAFIQHGNTLNSSEFEVGLCMTAMLRKAGVDLLFYADLIDAEVNDGTISNITVACCGRKLVFQAESFVDATGDAVLSRLAGAEILPVNVEETMTKTVLFRVSGVKEFDKKALMEMFGKMDFPLPFQDRFMGTPVCDGKDIVLNLTATAGDSLDPFELTKMDVPGFTFGNGTEEEHQKFLDLITYRKAMISFTSKEDIDREADGDYRLYFQ